MMTSEGQRKKIARRDPRVCETAYVGGRIKDESLRRLQNGNLAQVGTSCSNIVTLVNNVKYVLGHSRVFSVSFPFGHCLNLPLRNRNWGLQKSRTLTACIQTFEDRKICITWPTQPFYIQCPI